MVARLLACLVLVFVWGAMVGASIVTLVALPAGACS